MDVKRKLQHAFRLGELSRLTVTTSAELPFTPTYSPTDEDDKINSTSPPAQANAMTRSKRGLPTFPCPPTHKGYLALTQPSPTISTMRTVNVMKGYTLYFSQSA